jgi:hypothetical protein
MTSPVGSRPVQQGDHPAAADRAHVAKPAGISPGHSQEITNGHVKREVAASDAVQPRINALREKLHLPPDLEGQSSDGAVARLGQRLLGNAKTIDARIAQLEAQRADHSGGFESRKINHDIERLTALKELQGLEETKNNLCGKKENLWNEMLNLKGKLNDPKVPHAEFLKLAGEYRAKAAQLNSCSMKLTGEQESSPAQASVDIMDAITHRFSNPPKHATANFLREQLRDMQNEFRTYTQLSGGTTNTHYLESVRSNLHTALSKICGNGLMNNNLGVIPEIFKAIDGLGKAKA